MKASVLSCLAVTRWTIAWQVPHPWDFSGKNTALGCHFLPQGNLPSQGIEPVSPGSPTWQVNSLPTEPSEKLEFHLFVSKEFLVSAGA